MRLGKTIALAVAILCLSCLAQAAERAYSVQQGDGLDAIARRHHTSRATLLRLNPLVVPDDLEIGTELRVPVSSALRPRRQSRPVRSTARRLAVGQTVPHTTVPTSAKPAANTLPPVKLTQVAAPTVVKAAVPVAKIAPAEPSPAAAGEPFRNISREPGKDYYETSIGHIIVDAIWKLALVLGIAYLSIYALRGIMNRQAVLPEQKGGLKVLETVALGPNRSLHLVRVGNKVLVLGSTPDQVTAIGEMDEAEVTSQALPPTKQAFAGRLADAVAGENGGKAA